MWEDGRCANPYWAGVGSMPMVGQPADMRRKPWDLQQPSYPYLSSAEIPSMSHFGWLCGFSSHT